MSDQKKTGNRHSLLLDQMIAAAEKAKPKANTPFANTIIKIASTQPPQLSDALKKLAADVSKSNKILRRGQITRSVEPGFNGGNAEELSGVEDPNVDFDSMVGADDGGSPELEESGLSAPEPTGDMGMGGGDIEGAKRSLSDALIALCGSPQDAIACIEGNQGGEDDLGGDAIGDDLGGDDLDLGDESEELTGDELGGEGDEGLTDLDGSDSAGPTLGDAAADMPAPMPAPMPKPAPKQMPAPLI